MVYCSLSCEKYNVFYRNRYFGYVYKPEWENLVTMGFRDLYYEYKTIHNKFGEFFALLKFREKIHWKQYNTQPRYSRRGYKFEEFKYSMTATNEIVLAENQNFDSIVIRASDDYNSLNGRSVEYFRSYSNGRPVLLLSNGILMRIA